jgi:hypothetical protein
VREKTIIFQAVMFPLPLIPSHQGRGNMTFYEVANIKYRLIEPHIVADTSL